MINSIPDSSTGTSLLPSLDMQAAAVRKQLDSLVMQASTGLVSDSYSGLGAGLGASLTLSPQIGELQTYQQNVSQAAAKMQLAQGAISEIQKIASTFVSDIPNLNGIATSEVDSIAANARSALTQVADLLNTSEGGVYVFSGQDSQNPAIPSGDDILRSNFFLKIQSAVSSLSANGASATLSETLNVASSNDPNISPFSTYLSNPPAGLNAPVIQADQHTTLQIGLLASANLIASSDPKFSTGSYMRDLLRSLATLGSLTSGQASGPDFDTVVSNIGRTLNDVVRALGVDAGFMGTVQATLTNKQSQLATTITALKSQVAGAQEVDMASVLSQLTSTQTRLQESYRLISAVGTLSLAAYLPNP